MLLRDPSAIPGLEEFLHRGQEIKTGCQGRSKTRPAGRSKIRPLLSGGIGFGLLELQGWLERRPVPPLGGAFRPERKAPLQIAVSCGVGLMADL